MHRKVKISINTNFLFTFYVQQIPAAFLAYSKLKLLSSLGESLCLRIQHIVYYRILVCYYFKQNNLFLFETLFFYFFFQLVDKCKAQSHLSASVNEALAVSVLVARIATLDDVSGICYEARTD